MKVTYSLADSLIRDLKAHCERTGYTQSGLVSVALNMYLMLNNEFSDRPEVKAVVTMLNNPNQMDIYQALNDSKDG